MRKISGVLFAMFLTSVSFLNCSKMEALNSNLEVANSGNAGVFNLNSPLNSSSLILIGSNLPISDRGVYGTHTQTDLANDDWFAQNGIKPLTRSYHLNRSKIQRYLQQMSVGGQKAIANILWFGTDTSDLNKKLPADPWGHVSDLHGLSGGGELSDIEEENIRNFLTDLRNNKFSTLILRLAPQAGMERIFQPISQSEFDQRMALISPYVKHLLKIYEANAGSLNILYDVCGECGGISDQNSFRRMNASFRSVIEKSEPTRNIAARILGSSIVASYSVQHNCLPKRSSSGVVLSNDCVYNRIVEYLKADPESTAVSLTMYSEKNFHSETEDSLEIIALEKALRDMGRVGMPVYILETYSDALVYSAQIARTAKRLKINVKAFFSWPISLNASVPHFSAEACVDSSTLQSFLSSFDSISTETPPTETPPTETPPTETPPTENISGRIKADTTTCSIPENGTVCSVRLTWSTSNATNVRVYVKETGKIFAEGDSNFNGQIANWITADGFTFELKANGRTISSVRVVGIETNKKVDPTPSENEKRVKAIFYEVLKRDPSSSTIAFYINLLNIGSVTERQIRDELVNSDEGKCVSSNGSYNLNIQTCTCIGGQLLVDKKCVQSTPAPDAEAPVINQAGAGCSDFNCIFIIGTNFGTTPKVEIRYLSGWNIVDQYSGASVNLSIDSRGRQVITLRLRNQEQIDEFHNQGLRIHVTNNQGVWNVTPYVVRGQ